MKAQTYFAACACAALTVHVFSEYVRPLHFSFAFIPYFTLGASLYAAREQRARFTRFVVLLSYLLIGLHFSRYTQGKIPLSIEWLEGLSRPTVFVPVLVTLTLPGMVVWLARMSV